MSRMGRTGRNWSSPNARQCRLSWAFVEIHVRREGETTSRNDPKGFYHLSILLDFLEGKETPEPWACSWRSEELGEPGSPSFLPKGLSGKSGPS